MPGPVQTSIPPGTMTPLGPYSRFAKAGGVIMVSGTAGVDPATNELAGPDVGAQTRQIMATFEAALTAAGSDFDHVLHINVFLVDMDDFAEMNTAYAGAMGDRRPARTCVAVTALPKPGARVTMNLMAAERG